MTNLSRIVMAAQAAIHVRLVAVVDGRLRGHDDNLGTEFAGGGA